MFGVSLNGMQQDMNAPSVGSKDESDICKEDFRQKNTIYRLSWSSGPGDELRNVVKRSTHKKNK